MPGSSRIKPFGAYKPYVHGLVVGGLVDAAAGGLVDIASGLSFTFMEEPCLCLGKHSADSASAKDGLPEGTEL